jgi:hypothetical protein
MDNLRRWSRSWKMRKAPRSRSSRSALVKLLLREISWRHCNTWIAAGRAETLEMTKKHSMARKAKSTETNQASTYHSPSIEENVAIIEMKKQRLVFSRERECSRAQARPKSWAIRLHARRTMKTRRRRQYYRRMWRHGDNEVMSNNWGFCKTAAHELLLTNKPILSALMATWYTQQESLRLSMEQIRGCHHISRLSHKMKLAEKLRNTTQWTLHWEVEGTNTPAAEERVSRDSSMMRKACEDLMICISTMLTTSAQAKMAHS